MSKKEMPARTARGDSPRPLGDKPAAKEGRGKPDASAGQQASGARRQEARKGDRRTRGPARDRSESRRGRSRKRASSEPRPAPQQSAPRSPSHRGRSLSTRRDKDRSVSRRRRLVESVRGRKEARKPSRTRVTLQEGHDNSILVFKQAENTIQARAKGIRRGKYGDNLDALYLLITVTMPSARKLDQACFSFQFRQHKRPNDPLRIVHYSPRKLLGTPQDVDESKSSGWGLNATVGASGASAGANKTHDKGSKLVKKHRPVLEVTEADHEVTAILYKEGEECQLPSQFAIQVVVPYNWKHGGLDIACDARVDKRWKYWVGWSHWVGRSAWRKVEPVKGHTESMNYDQWKENGKWEEEGGCQEFKTSESIW